MEGKEKTYHDAECQLGSREQLLQQPPFRRGAGLEERSSEVASLIPEVHLLVGKGTLDVVVHVHVAPGERVQLGRKRAKWVPWRDREAQECPTEGGETSGRRGWDETWSHRD